LRLLGGIEAQSNHVNVRIEAERASKQDRVAASKRAHCLPFVIPDLIRDPSSFAALRKEVGRGSSPG
jgi:hypothetical protein